MSRTVKWEHKSDGIHTCHKLHRQARPAGRIVPVLEAEAMLDGGPEPWDLCFVPVMDEGPEVSDWDDYPFCYICGRATDHFAEHCDLVELGYAYYTVEGSTCWTPAGRAWNMSLDPLAI